MLARARKSAAVLAELTASGDVAPARFVDLAISIRIADVEGTGEHARWKPGTDEEIVRVGGRWDRRSKRWAGPASTGIVMRLHRGQERAGRWIAEWLRRKQTGDWSGFVKAWTLCLCGGRRAGKSDLGVRAILAYAIMAERSIAWMVSPTLEAGAELDHAIREMLPRGWYTRREAATGSSLTYRLANGSRIHLRSGHKTSTLRAGRADAVLVNEAQLQDHRAYVNLRGAIADRSGICIVAANPPDTARGRWVTALVRDAEAGAIEAVAFQLDARENPFVDYAALASLEREVDSNTFARDVLGHFTAIGDVVFYAWGDECWRDPPADLVDVTPQLTKAQLGRASAFVIGMDFQRQPAMVAIAMRMFRDPDDENEVLTWLVDEFIVEHATEYELLDVIERTPMWTLGAGAPETREPGATTYRGWLEQGARASAAPQHCAVIMDASGFFQDGAHNPGRTSDRALRSRRWSELHKPQIDSDKNPIIVERMKVGNARLKSASGQRRLFVARHCEWSAEALRSYPMRNGVPDRRHELAHVVDAITYPLYRLFGRPKFAQSPLRYVPVRDTWKTSRSQMIDRSWGTTGSRRGW